MEEFLNLNNEIVIYQSEDGKTVLDVRLEDDTVWLSQQQMSELFKQTGQLSVVIYVTSTRMENWKKSQHVQKMHRFEWKVTVW